MLVPWASAYASKMYLLDFVVFLASRNLKYNHVDIQCVLLKTSVDNIRGRFDKYLASPPEGSAVAKEIYYRVVHSRRQLLSTFLSNRTCSFVLTACGNGRVREFYKN